MHHANRELQCSCHRLRFHWHESCHETAIKLQFLIAIRSWSHDAHAVCWQNFPFRKHQTDCWLKEDNEFSPRIGGHQCFALAFSHMSPKKNFTCVGFQTFWRSFYQMRSTSKVTGVSRIVNAHICLICFVWTTSDVSEKIVNAFYLSTGGVLFAVNNSSGHTTLTIKRL